MSKATSKFSVGALEPALAPHYIFLVFPAASAIFDSGNSSLLTNLLAATIGSAVGIVLLCGWVYLLLKSKNKAAVAGSRAASSAREKMGYKSFVFQLFVTLYLFGLLYCSVFWIGCKVLSRTTPPFWECLILACVVAVVVTGGIVTQALALDRRYRDKS